MNRILESKSNSARRFPKGRVLGSKTTHFSSVPTRISLFT
ncbi:hypothetical protein LEP1GSC021_0440 [Leptospira noguchii str. 1993005606]|nr:hypothetical protein LEP1GSC021_0440 [Leptospira noguchii str. 1993005606]